MNRGVLALGISIALAVIIGAIGITAFFVIQKNGENSGDGDKAPADAGVAVSSTPEESTRVPEEAGAKNEILPAGQPKDDAALLALESELAMALKSGGINPDTYGEIIKKLNDLEARGADKNRLEALRTGLERLTVGGGKNSRSAPAQSPPAAPNAPAQATTPKTTSPPPQANMPAAASPVANCVSNPNPVFINHITDITKFSQIKPPPNKDPGGGLKPHSYIETHGARVPVYAPVDMTLRGGAYYIGGPYMLDFRVSCEVTLRFGHITEPLEEIRNIFQDTPAPQSDSRGQAIKHEISFRAGDLVGYTTGTNPGAGNWDFGVYNSSVKNRYAADPNYNQSDVNTTAVCPYRYFAPDLKEIYRQKFDFSGYGNLVPDGESFCANI